MCGRYAASASADLLIEEFEIEEVDPSGVEATQPNFNVAPTDIVPAVAERPSNEGVTRRLVGLRWGLVPSWSKSATGGARMINARRETVAEKPAFRKAFATRRCLLPATGYYEWRALPEGGKQPYFIRPSDGGLLVMGGIFEFWRSADGWLSTASIITTQATDAMGWVHDRMPIIIARENRDAWLDPSLTNPESATGLWHVAQPTELEVYPVGKAVGNVANNGAQLIAPLKQE